MFGTKKKVKEIAKQEVRPCILNPQIQQVGDKTIMRVNCADCFANASFGNTACMEGISKTLSGVEGLTEIVLLKNYNKVFREKDIKLLKEVGEVTKNVDIKEFCEACSEIVSQLWGDPVYAYYKLKEKECRKCQNLSKELTEKLGKTKLVSEITKSKNLGYKDIFVPHLIPDIVCSFVDQEKPGTQAEEVYEVDGVGISLHTIPARPDMIYFAEMPELSLAKDEVETIKNVIEKLTGQKKNIDLSPEKVRDDFRRHISNTLDLQTNAQIKSKLEKIILRHTIGYGVIEPLLLDERVQDVYVDSGSPQVHIVHQDFGECITNLYVTKEEIEKLSTRLRALSKRPLDASSPVLHTELEDLGVRVCGICEPSTYRGTGFAFRKRKPIPWTLAELVHTKMLNSDAAGFLSYLAENQNSILITGPRSSGKTSLLTALIMEMPRSSRIILIEDTPEIPVEALRSLGFKIEHLKTEAFAKGFEISTEDALRTSLRLGDSILVIGEVRGKEAKALFEAMRIGASGNVVLGTIHGSNPYDTFDRVVNDLGVPKTSFKAVDFIVTAGLVKKGDSLSRKRRLLGISEVTKNWSEEPKFRDLVSYSSYTDKWKTGLKKSEKLKLIASMKSLKFNEVLRGIKAKAQLKSDLVKLGKKSKKYLGPAYTVNSNSVFSKMAGETKNYKKITKDSSLWLRKS